MTWLGFMSDPGGQPAISDNVSQQQTPHQAPADVPTEWPVNLMAEGGRDVDLLQVLQLST